MVPYGMVWKGHGLVMVRNGIIWYGAGSTLRYVPKCGMVSLKHSSYMISLNPTNRHINDKSPTKNYNISCTFKLILITLHVYIQLFPLLFSL